MAITVVVPNAAKLNLLASAPKVTRAEGHGTIRLDKNVGVNIANERLGVVRQDKNVGVDIANERLGVARQDQNVGEDVQNAREAYLRLDWGDVSNNTPTPHAWYVRPDHGREGWEVKVVGHGFGDLQATYSGEVLLNALLMGVIEWIGVAGTADALGPNRLIDPLADVVNVEHEEIRVTVPTGAVSGLIKVRTDGP